MQDCAGTWGGTAENCPDWEDDPGGYEFVSFLIGGIVLYDGEQLGDAGDLLAALGSDGSVRGVAVQLSPPFGPYAGTTLYEMTMRSNNPGEVLSFHYYDASSDEVLDISESYTFVANEQLGDVMAPFELNITTSVDLSIDLISGYNWISFNVVPEDASLSGILGSLGTDANFVASQSDGVSNNYGDYGWYGSLATMEPGNGYLLEMLAGGTLYYPAFNGLSRLAENKQEVVLSSTIENWDFNYADYRYIGAVTLSIEGREDFDGDVVGAFVDDECRGIAERMYFPFNDSYMYIIQVYSNIENGEELTFKYYDKTNDVVVEYSETLTFENYMNIGNGFNTLALSRERDLSQPSAYSISDAYPNTFNPVTSFEYTIPEDGMVQVAIYDISGRMVSELVNGYQSAGTYPVEWDAQKLSSGVYMVNMTAGDYSTIQKVMLIK